MKQNINAYPLENILPHIQTINESMTLRVEASPSTLVRLLAALDSTTLGTVQPREGHEDIAVKGYVSSARGPAALVEVPYTQDNTLVVVNRQAYVDTTEVYTITPWAVTRVELPYGVHIKVSSATPKKMVSLQNLKKMLQEDIETLKKVNGRGTKFCLNMSLDTFESLEKLAPSAITSSRAGGNPSLWGNPCGRDDSLPQDRVCLALTGGVLLAWKVYNVQMGMFIEAPEPEEETDLVPASQVGWSVF